MKLVILWPEISGYMAACWRALARRKNIDLFVLAYASNRPGAVNLFADDVMAGIPCRLLTPQERDDEGLIHRIAREEKPDVIMISGWSTGPYMSLVKSGLGAKVIMAMDTPRRGGLRQRLARFWLARFLKRIDRIMVPGERSFQYAVDLGFPEEHIHRGLYCSYVKELGAALEQRLSLPGGWPRSFLYVGRYAPEKALDVLLEAHRLYRQRTEDPWPLRCCGNGPLEHVLAGHEGVEDLGFVQPGEQPATMAGSGVFCLASRSEPWGLVLVEACAAGLPIICTNACGSAVEVVRSYYNGLMVPPDNARAFAEAMLWMHQHHDLLPELGKRARSLAQPYDASVWAVRLEAICEGLRR